MGPGYFGAAAQPEGTLASSLESRVFGARRTAGRCPVPHGRLKPQDSGLGTRDSGLQYAPAVEFRIILSPSDFDRSWSFYRDTIGLEVLRSWDEGGRGGILIVDGGSQIELLDVGVDGTTDHPDGVRVAWQVDDVDAEADRLAALGVVIIDPPQDQPWGHRNTRFADPDGVPITLFTVLEEG